jgi:hypothetical protein
MGKKRHGSEGAQRKEAQPAATSGAARGAAADRAAPTGGASSSAAAAASAGGNAEVAPLYEVSHVRGVTTSVGTRRDELLVTVHLPGVQSAWRCIACALSRAWACRARTTVRVCTGRRADAPSACAAASDVSDLVIREHRISLRVPGRVRVAQAARSTRAVQPSPLSSRCATLSRCARSQFRLELPLDTPVVETPLAVKLHKVRRRGGAAHDTRATRASVAEPQGTRGRRESP